MGRKIKSAPWDKPKAKNQGPAPIAGHGEDPPGGARGPSGAEVEVSLDFGSRPSGEGPEPAKQPAPNATPISSAAPPPASDPRADSFWSLAPADPEADLSLDGDEHLSGTGEIFDPATGWDYTAVSNESMDSGAVDAAAQSGADLAPAQPVPDSAPEQPVPDLAPAQPVPDSAPEQPVPDLAPEPAEPPDEADSIWASLASSPDLTTDPGAAAPVKAPTVGAESDESHEDLAGPPSHSELPELPGFDESGTWRRSPTDADTAADDVSVTFDDDGFFSIAEEPAPTTHVDDSVSGIGPSAAPTVGNTSAVEQVEESGEFEFHVDQSSPDLGDDIFSQAQLPSIPPDMAALPADEAILKAQDLFKEGEIELGMALLESTRVMAPADARISSWLEYGEQKLIQAFCPAGGLKRIPTLRYDAERLLRVTAGDQRTIVEAIDGERTLEQLREHLHQIPAVGFWKDVGKLVRRGWLGWAD